MGCAESVPVADNYKVHHQVKPSIKPLGAHVQAGPSSSQPVKVIVREKLFSWSGDSFQITDERGAPFGDGLQVQGKAMFSIRDRMTLLDGSGTPVAVCLRKFELMGQTFKIYTTRPIYPGQTPSERHYDGNLPLYTYASVEREPFTFVQKVKVGQEATPSFTIHRAGALLGPKQRVVKYHGQVAANIQSMTWLREYGNRYLITINPGIDPCLVICLSAICDEMDEDK